jgi:hypothetical protein
MIAQMKTLLRVKELKHDQALRAMQAKRQQRDVARDASKRAMAEVEESAATYAQREDAIYAEVIGQVIDRGEVDATHGRVVLLEKAHALLKDALERALHIEARLEAELETATARYFAALRKRDKFEFLADDMRRQADALAELHEETEVEDLFARPRGRAA